MTHTTRAGLRVLLENGYAAFRDRLKRRLGSDDLAEEALQDAWLRLARGGDVGLVQNAENYLFRIALNVAADRREAESRRLSQVEVHAVLHVADDALDPERIAEAHSEFTALERALAELTPRRRDIFILARVEEMPHDEIARRFRISPRMVEKELSRALDHCAARLERNVVRRFGPRPRERS
ncbi:MAG TPA: RNA polymerase sigma factor [Bradyrhizobium sp.]|nr:RNA polymerase sigma factor [Bradyrhizobium sp.]